MATTIDTLQINVQTNARTAAKDLDRLVASLNKLGGAGVKSASGGIKGFHLNLKNLIPTLNRLGTTGVKTAENGIKSLASTMSKLTPSFKAQALSANALTSSVMRLAAQYISLRSVFQGIQSSIDLSSSLTEENNVFYTVFGTYTAGIEELLKDSAQTLGMSELSVKKVANNFQQLGVSLGISQKEAAAMSKELVELSADVTSMFNVESVERTAEIMRSIYTGQTRPLRQFGVDITQANLQQYALSKGIKKNITDMTQAEKVALRYNYVMEVLSYTEGDFAKTAHTWANATRTLMENIKALGTILGGAFINILRPLVNVLNAVMNKFIQFTQTVVDSLGAIFGWTIETSAAASTIDDEFYDALDEMEGKLGESEDDAGGLSNNLDESNKNAQKLKRTILGFDELNVLNGPSDSSGSGSGSGKKPSGIKPSTGIITEIKHAESLIDYYQSEITTLFALGGTISNTLRDVLEGIDWPSIYDKARGFGTGLADFLNGLIRPETFAALGDTVAGAINTVFNAADAFAQRFDFSNLGNAVGLEIQHSLDGIDWPTVYSALDEWAVGIADFLNSLCTVETFKSIGTAVANAINGVFHSAALFSDKLEFSDIGTAVATGIQTALDGIEWPDVFATLSNFGTGVAEFLNGLLTAETFHSVGVSLAQALNAALKGAMHFLSGLHFGDIGSGLSQGISDALATVEWGDVYAVCNKFAVGLADFLNGLFDPKTFASLGSAVGNAVSAVFQGSYWFAYEFKFDNFGNALREGLVNFLNNIPWATALAGAKKWGSGIADALNSFLTEDTFVAIGHTVAKLLQTVLTFAFDLGNNIEFSEIGSNFAAGINKFISDFPFTLLADTLSTWAIGLLDAIIAAIGDISWTDLGIKIQQMIKNIKWDVILRRAAKAIWTGLNAAIDFMVGIFNKEGVVSPIEEAFADIKETLASFVEDVPWEDIAASISSIAESLTPFVEGFGAGFLDFFNGILEIGADVLEAIGDALAWVAEKLSTVDSDTLEKVGKALGTIVAAVAGFMIATKIKNIFTALAGGLGTLGTAIKRHPIMAIWFALTTIVEVLEELGLLPEGWEKPLIAGITAICGIITVGSWVKKIADLFKGKAAQKVISDAVEKTVGGGITEGVAKASVSQTIATAMKGLWSTVLVPLGSAALVAAIAVGVGALVTAGIKKAAGLIELIQGGNGETTPEGISAEAWIESLGLSNEEVQELWSKIEQWETEGIAPEELFRRVTEELEKLGVSAEQAQNALQNYNVVGSSTTENMALMYAATENLGEGWSKYSESAALAAQDSNAAWEILWNAMWEFVNKGGEAGSTYEAISKILGDTQNFPTAESALTGIINLLNDMDKSGQLTNAFLQTMKDMYPDVFTNVTTGANNAATAIANVGAEAGNLGGHVPSMSQLAHWAQQADTDVGNLGTTADNTADSSSDMGTAMSDFTSEQMREAERFTKISGKVGDIGGAAADVSEETGTMGSAFATEMDRMKTKSQNSATDVSKHIGDMGLAEGDFVTASADMGTSVDGSLTTMTTSFRTWRQNNGTIISELNDDVTLFTGNLATLGQNMYDSLEDPYTSEENAANMYNYVSKFITNNIEGGIRDAADMHSPSRVMIGLGENMINSLASGMDAMQYKVSTVAYDMASAIQGAFQNTYSIMASIGSRMGQSLANGFRSTHIPLPHIHNEWRKLQYGDQGQYFYVPNLSLEWYARGGFPKAGQMFIANENGPEMIGQIGNKNAVANQQQITDALKAAMLEGLIEYGGIGGRGQNDAPFVLNATIRTQNDEVLARAVERGNAKRNMRYGSTRRAIE